MGDLNVDGLIVNNPDALIFNHPGATITNTGNTINNYGTINNRGTIDNAGRITNEPGGTVVGNGAVTGNPIAQITDPDAEGGCCMPDDTCTVSTQAECDAQEGTYQGDGSDCTGDSGDGTSVCATGPPPTGGTGTGACGSGIGMVMITCSVAPFLRYRRIRRRRLPRTR